MSYFGIVLFNLIVIQRSRVAPKRWGSILKPLLASCVMGAAVYFLYSPLSSALGGKLAAIACAAAGVVIYLLSLFFIRGIYREDIEMLPKGEKIANFLKLE